MLLALAGGFPEWLSCRQLDKGDAAHAHGVAGVLIHVVVLQQQFPVMTATIAQVALAAKQAEAMVRPH